MYGLAGLPVEMEKQAAGILDTLTKQVQERGMSEEDFRAFTDRLKEQYGNNTDYVYTERPTAVGGSFALGEKGLEKARNSSFARRLLGIDPSETATSFVKSVPLEDVALHETGHVLDPEMDTLVDKATRARKVSALSSLGSAAVPHLNHEKVPEKAKWAIGAGLAGISGLAAGRASAHTNRMEENANRFVKEHWTQELGSAEAAEKRFSESVLPEGRKTYGRAAAKGLKSGLTAGGLFAASMLKKQR